MIVHFNISPGPNYGRITKETLGGCNQRINVNITVEEARACWEKVGTIKDCNWAFRRLATDHDFDVRGCLEWYKTQD